MDPAQLANEALKRFEALHAPGTTVTRTETRDAREPGSEPLLEVFDHLGKLDGWAKIAMDRLVGDPQDGRAAQELRRSLEQTARLHPQFTRRLADCLADRPTVKTSLSSPVPPVQSSTARGLQTS
jgi:hypothetical protein